MKNRFSHTTDVMQHRSEDSSGLPKVENLLFEYFDKQQKINNEQKF